MAKAVFCAVFAAAMFLSSTSANAAEAWASSRRLTYIYPLSYGLVFAYDGAMLNKGVGCSENRAVLPIAAGNYQVIVSALIMAFAGNYIIDVNYDDTTTGGCEMTINRVVVRRL